MARRSRLLYHRCGNASRRQRCDLCHRAPSQDCAKDPSLLMPTVLFIDDHTCGSHTLAHKLRAYGYEVQVAPDEEEALTLFRLYAIDAVITDCHPEIPGRGTIAPALRRISPNVPIIMMSAFCRLPCSRLRYADGCVQKGDVTALLAALRMLLCSRAFGLCQSVAA